MFSLSRLFSMMPVVRRLSIRAVSLWMGTVALVGLLTMTGGCSDGEASESTSEARSEPTVRVEALVLEPTSFTDVIEVTGTVEAIDDATLSAQTNGPVTMLLELGAQVQSGQPVAKIDAEEAAAAVEQAKAQYELAQDRYERQKPLYQDSIVSALEFEQVRSERNQARASLQQARKRLANTIVEAPFAGTVEERFGEVGEQAAPGMKVVRLVNTRRVKVAAGVPERYANDIRRGTPVQLDFRRYGAGVRTATVTFVGNTIDPESRTFTIEATVDNPEGTLKPSMSTTLRVTRSVRDSALVIPRTAVLRDETGTHVYVVDRSDTTAVARNRDVTLGPETGGRIVVTSGLEAEDEIIVVGQNNVSPGTPLEVSTRHDRPADAGASEADPSLPTPPAK